MTTILVGSAPDSWGVWFPDDPNQTPYTRFLDEVAGSGYQWIELGPYGYLPTDPQKLSDELASRNLKLSAGTVFEHLHQDNSWDAVWKQIEDVAKLTAAVGGKHVVVIPEMWRDPATGEVLEDRNLTAEQWRKKTGGMNDLGKAMFEKYGVRAQYHPHADSHVDTEENVYRFLDGTNSEYREPVPGHRPHQLLRWRQPGDHQPRARPHRVPAPQAGRSRGARQGRGRGPAVR